MNMDSGWIKIHMRESESLQCPHCGERYPRVEYIEKANYCPNCGRRVCKVFILD